MMAIDNSRLNLILRCIWYCVWLPLFNFREMLFWHTKDQRHIWSCRNISRASKYSIQAERK